MTFGEEDYWRNLFNQTEIAIRNNYDLFAEIAERPSTKYHPKLSIKGNQWIASYSNVEEGTTLVGAGDSPQEAINDFDKEFRSRPLLKFPIAEGPTTKVKEEDVILANTKMPIPDSQITDKNAEEIAKFKLNGTSTITEIPEATECIVINQDGNQFCALMGPNLQEGFSGFGDTPLHAILELIAYQTENLGLKEILNQKPDPEHWTYPKGE